ncbi:nuclear distribution protein nudE-like 1 [Halichondria panicea]|uniref:nuclear distribution protein nudE-like 1 n=1 Tax=Halichondria panicea TaxID=6063 RepID=UPI00312B9436
MSSSTSTHTGEGEPSFGEVQDELDYWKRRALEYKASLEEVRGEFDDYQESSRELEAELEAQLEQAEGNNKDLLSRVARLEEENDSLKSKLDVNQSETYVSLSTLQEERSELTALKETLQTYVRQLEQANDDLERGKRSTMSSLEDFEKKLNQAFERNAILENELDEKARLGEMCQRLKDEVRDLHAEMSRENKKRTPTSGSTPLPSVTATHTVPTTIRESPLIKANPSPEGTPLHTTFVGSQNFTPSTRISALNMVGDLLRKVGALESRLALCRTHISPKERRVGSPVEGSKAKRMHLVKEPPNLTKITV